MDFDERRARALETVVQYRPGTGPSREPPQTRARPPQDDRQHQQPRPAPPPAPEPAEAAASARPMPAPQIRRVSRTLRAGVAAGGVDAAAVADARRARAWQQTERLRSWSHPKAPQRRRMATPWQTQRWPKARTPISTMVRLKPGPTGTTPAKSRIPQRSEARCRGAALRRRHQRRRRAACPLCRRAPVAARRGRRADDVRARLCHVARRLCAGHGNGEWRARAPVSSRSPARSSCVRPMVRSCVQSPAFTSRRAEMARRRRTEEHAAARGICDLRTRDTTTSFSSAIATITRITGRRHCPRALSSCRRRSGTKRSASGCRRAYSAACAR